LCAGKRCRHPEAGYRVAQTVVARPMIQLLVERRDDENSIWCVGVERDGVSHCPNLDKLAELIRIIDGAGVELIGTNDTRMRTSPFS
jgi:hypothetical protein